MRPFGQGSVAGVYHGVIKEARLQGGVLWAKVMIPAWSTPTGDYVTNWARVAIPWGTHDFGLWGSLHQNEHVLVAFEGGDPERPWVIGFVPMPQEDTNPVEAPPEWLNDKYADKTPNTNAPPGRENPPQSGPEMLPGVILKSPRWKQYFLLHDKLKKVVMRVALEGDHDWPAKPQEEKPEIHLGELATHNVLLGDLFMELYNNHKHKDVQRGGDVSGPPRDEDLIDPEQHLSHVVYVVRDPMDQAPDSSAFRLPTVGKKLFQAAAGGGGGGGIDILGAIQGALETIIKTVQDVVKAMQEFCKDPAGFIGNLAEQCGVPKEIVDAGKQMIGDYVVQFLDAGISLAEDFTGSDLPTVEDICGLVEQLSQGDLAGAAKDIIIKGVKWGLAAVGVPPEITDKVISIGEQLADKGLSLENIVGVVGEEFGAEGLTALAGALTAGFAK